MKSFIPTLLFLIFLTGGIQAQERKVLNLQSNWKFMEGSSENAFQKELDDESWETVEIPHDWAISKPFDEDGDGNTGKLPWKGEAWYRLKIQIPEKDAGQRFVLLADGIMAFPEIYVNGNLVGKWDYGYNSFYIDITKAILPGVENTIAIHVDTRKHQSRWYPGAGIYRKIQLLTLNPIHLKIWGTKITTPIIKKHYSDVRIASTIQNTSSSETKLRIVQSILNKEKQPVTSKEMQFDLAANSEKTIEQTITLSYPTLWDTENPYLYAVKTQVFQNEVLIDESSSNFGVRTFRFTADNGLYLNNKRIQLQGVNLHHDFGPLGSAFNKRAAQRQLEIMKNMGVNAIRNSHNVAAPEMLDLCDEMGLLFLDEAFDKYTDTIDLLEETDFEEYAARNVRNWIERDRNHPCVFLWSVGNEIPDVQWNINNGFQRLNTMLSYVKKYDESRPTTLVCDSYESAKLRHFDYYDVHSWNYGRRYRLARELEPNKSVIISESASTVSTRGFYELPLPKQKTDFTNSLQVSSYDLNAPEWAEIADDDFMWQQEENYIAGEFVWTGFDYLGEPTPYTNQAVKAMGFTDQKAARSSYFGIVDLVGIPKDRFYLYKSYWKPKETTVHILPHWNWEESKYQEIPVFVYTNGDCAELFLNGKSLGMRCKNPKASNSVERFRLIWDSVPYQPGELKAIAYKEGKVIGESQLKTAGKAYQLRLTPDRSKIAADGDDLSYILIEALDKDGNLCPLADDKIELKLNGPGKIAGVGNGNPQSLDSFRASSIRLFYGKAMLIIRSTNERGKITIEASAEKLKSAQTKIETK
ncbi:MAG: DUF4982 domain-containing protein [Bacteroidales bacterium]|nr:DUF4982 domain-containing protein [Bacteroidales bacterium]